MEFRQGTIGSNGQPGEAMIKFGPPKRVLRCGVRMSSVRYGVLIVRDGLPPHIPHAGCMVEFLLVFFRKGGGRAGSGAVPDSGVRSIACTDRQTPSSQLHTDEPLSVASNIKPRQLLETVVLMQKDTCG